MVVFLLEVWLPSYTTTPDANPRTLETWRTSSNSGLRATQIVAEDRKLLLPLKPVYYLALPAEPAGSSRA